MYLQESRKTRESDYFQDDDSFQLSRKDNLKKIKLFISEPVKKKQKSGNYQEEVFSTQFLEDDKDALNDFSGWRNESFDSLFKVQTEDGRVFEVLTRADQPNMPFQGLRGKLGSYHYQHQDLVDNSGMEKKIKEIKNLKSVGRVRDYQDEDYYDEFFKDEDYQDGGNSIDNFFAGQDEVSSIAQGKETVRSNEHYVDSFGDLFERTHDEFKVNSEEDSKEYPLSVKSEPDSRELENYQEGSTQTSTQDIFSDQDDTQDVEEDSFSETSSQENSNDNYDDIFGEQDDTTDNDGDNFSDFFGVQDGKQSKSEEANNIEDSLQEIKIDDFDDLFGEKDETHLGEDNYGEEGSTIDTDNLDGFIEDPDDRDQRNEFKIFGDHLGRTTSFNVKSISL